MKAKILKVGTIRADGHPFGWEFSCEGIETPPAAFNIDEDGVCTIAGYTIDELRNISQNTYSDKELRSLSQSINFGLIYGKKGE